MQATLYMNKIDGIGAAATTDVGTYSTTDAVFTDAFTGSFNAGVTAGSGTTSIAPNPKREGCTQAPRMHCASAAHAPHSHTLCVPRGLRPCALTCPSHGAAG